MSMIRKIKDKYRKSQIKREDMCISELDKQIKKRKQFFLMMYCMTIFFTYVGFIVTFDISQIIAGIFIVIMFSLFTTIAFIDYLYTRLLKYLKYNLED